MAVVIDTTPPIRVQHPKARLLRGLIRHVSAPARPHQRLQTPSSSESSHRRDIQRSSPSPTHASGGQYLQQPDLTELSLMQAAASRLRLDRNDWRATAQVQKNQLISSERKIESQRHAIAILEDQNTALRAEREDDVSAFEEVLARFQNVVEKHDKLAEQLNDSMRAIARVKKSDRAKGKVWQRNLMLKTTLQRVKSHPDAPHGSHHLNTEAALQEALALAKERIEELESRGEALLDALEKQDDSCDSNGDGSNDEERAAGLLETEVAFRGVLEDEMFREQKEHWDYLLQE
ncbi:hypothetical protein EK21DRAFT_62579 [Setomelanomma holmii]|uniref:Uncharacterized protein n=1 Tax=Setomelanomma holmii TaxID=210430 RepID=A0A9P4LNY8_9PLEO|nr:hypothetical protein EK21DRAFT_62579 [Setomelanomma holmii]